MVRITTQLIPKGRDRLSFSAFRANTLTSLYAQKLMSLGVCKRQCSDHPDHVSRLIIIAQETEPSYRSIEAADFCCMKFIEEVKSVVLKQ